MREVSRYDEWGVGEAVDGSGMNVAESAEFLAGSVPPKVAAMLCAELRNTVVPLYDRTEGLPGMRKQFQRVLALADALEDVARSAE